MTRPLGFLRPGRTFVIAEIGVNFEGDMARAEGMVRAAASAGVDAVKFQTVFADKIATRSAKKFWDIEGCPGETQHDEFSQTYYPTLAEYRRLKRLAESRGLLFFSTPEDDTSAVDMLERLRVPLYKVSSLNITHFPLLKRLARTGKPILLSTGASTLAEVAEAVEAIRAEGNGRIALLHCVSNYPTLVENANLRMMTHLQNAFPDLPVGYSDHSPAGQTLEVLAAAVSLGARLIEKHFTFDSSRPGYDHAISADYGGLKRIVSAIRAVERALGSGIKAPLPSEAKSRLHARRSLVAAQDIPAGAVLRRSMIDIKRPGTGLPPRFLDNVLGRRAKRRIPGDTLLSWDMLGGDS